MTKLKYLDHLDSLRALAVLLVLLFHLDISLFKGGFIGVDVFFVISGFLITRNITHEYRTTQGFNISRFYYRRVKRLMPSYFLTSIFVFILGFLLLSPSDFIGLTESIFSGSIALSNFYFLGESGYFDTAAKLKPMLHTWSLSVEEQYYFIWPLTLFLFLKGFSKYKTYILILSLSIIAFIATFYINAYGVSEEILIFFSRHKESTTDLQSLLFFMLPFRTYEFLMGALLVFIPEIHIRNEKTKGLITSLGFLLILVPAVIFNDKLSYLSILNIIPCAGISLLIIAPQTKYFKWFYLNNMLRQTGNASYTIYLFHWPIIVYYKHLYDKPINLISGLILFVLSIGISLLVYKYYETPFRQYKLKSIKLDYAKMAFMFLLFAGGSYAIKKNVSANDGWLWRLDEKNLALIEEIGAPVKYHYFNWGGVFYEFDTEIQSKQNPKESIDMVWLGDSHSGHFAVGLDSIMVKKHGLKVHISYVSCFVLPDIISTNDKCTLDADSVLTSKIKLLEKNPEAPLVISYYWNSRLFSFCKILDEETGEMIDPAKLGKEEAMQLLCEKIEKLRDILGKDRKIIVIGESPVRKGEINYIDKLLKPSFLSFISPVSNSFQAEQSTIMINDFMKEYFKDLDNFHFLDPSEPFCEDGTCISQVGNKIYFSDVNHFSKVGSVYIVEYFEDFFLNIMSHDEKE
ncbi:MAG: acyltransferase family protein [Bacteroidales bacterium]|nr:acyltransferase family protein [Bacteroidales bacterium]